MKKLFLLLLLAPIFAFSQIKYVTPTGAGAMDGSSWANAYPGTQLQTALSNATSEVWVAAGTYLPTYQDDIADARSKFFYIISGIKVYGGFPATGSPTMANRNPAVYVTTLSGDIDPVGNNDAYHVFYMRELPSTALLDGFTISGGRANGATNDKQLGAGIYNYSGGIDNDIFGGVNSSNPIINNCIFKNNYALGGAGIFNDGRGGGIASPTITNCIFMDNTGGRGGGIYNIAGVGTFFGSEVGGKSNPTIINCTFTNNVVTNLGGGIYNVADGNLCQTNPIITKCTFTNNQAINTTPGVYTAGGAIGNHVANKGTMNSMIENCTFTNNVVTYSGGAIWNYSNLNGGGKCTSIIQNCTFDGNEAKTHVGGAIFNSANEVNGSGNGLVIAAVENCLFRNNKAVYGGAAYNYSEYATCKPKFVNCTFTGNSATNFGGTLGNNTYLGIIDVFVVNSIFWGNSGTDKNISIQTVTAFTMTSSMLDEASCPANANVNCFQNQYNVDPLFVDPANGDFHLQPCSPAINAGADNVNATTTDLDGNPRIIGLLPDLGVYEAAKRLCIKASVNTSAACLGTTIKLSATGGTTYSWKGPNNFSSTSATPSLIVSVGIKGVYSVTGVSGTITGSATVSVSVATLQAGLVGTPCVGGVIELTASGMASYSWTRPASNFNSTLQNPVILSAKLTDAGMYLVTGKSGACTASAMVMVIVNSQSINPAFTVNPSSIAQGASVTLSATSGTGIYSWSGPNGFSGSTKSKTINSFQPVNNGVYRLTLISGLCKGYSEKTITINVAPRLAREESQDEISMEINAYPNPVTDKLTVVVTLKEPSALSLQLFNSMGNESGTWQLNEEVTVHKTELNMSELTGGIYLLQAQAGKHKVVKKVVKIQY